jgi:FdhD protein
MTATTSAGLAIRRVVRIEGADSLAREDPVVIEEPLEVRLNDQPYAVTMRTPGYDRELTAGLLISEGIVEGPADLLDIALCAHDDTPDSLNLVRAYVTAARLPAEEAWPSHRFANSGCGLCGRERIEQVLRKRRPLEDVPPVRRKVLLGLPARLRQAQRLFEASGGLHAAGLFGDLSSEDRVFEDVGRHNAVDKAVGDALLRGEWPLAPSRILMVSGRAGFEIVQKAAAAGIGTVCSVSAPSSLAVDLAREAGMILAGFVRGESMNVYSGEELVR